MGVVQNYVLRQPVSVDDVIHLREGLRCRNFCNDGHVVVSQCGDGTAGFCAVGISDDGRGLTAINPHDIQTNTLTLCSW